MKTKKKSFDKDKDIHNLRQLLRENILSTPSNKKTCSKETHEKNNQNINNKKLFSFSMLKYKPKRLINFKGINIPLPTLGKASLDYSKTFGLDNNISEIKQFSKTNIFNSKTIITKNKNKNNIELIKDDNLIEFKNIYILKYAQFSENFSKFYQYKELITDNRKRDFEDLYSKISKSLESQSQLLLNELDDKNKQKENKNISVSPYSTTTSGIESKNKNIFNIDDNNLNNKKKVLGLCAGYSSYVIKFFNILFKEIKEHKTEIIKLLKKNHEYELKINNLKKELNDLKNYLNKYNTSKRIFEEKEKENSIKIIKDKYLHKENEYVISMYKLEEEMHSLIQLLDKNKNYYNRYKEVENEINIKNKNNDMLRLRLNKELNEKNLQFLIEKDKTEELFNKLQELNGVINELKEQKEKQKRQEIEINAQILKMNITIEEKNENLMMMNEELEYYIREYNKEKYNHSNTIAALRSLENRIYNEKKDNKN